MKANFIEFETKLDLRSCGNLFREGVERRPLKLKAARFQFFTPTSIDDPFEALDDSIKPDFSIGAGYELAELYGTVLMMCAVLQNNHTLVQLRSTGNIRGRLMTNSLMKSLLDRFGQSDPTVNPESFSGRI